MVDAERGAAFMKVVGMVSAYKEGRLVRGCVESLLRVGLDHLYIFEGPAGDPLGDDVPASDYQYLPTLRELQDADEPGAGCTLHEGRWRTDARKRNEMLQRAKAEWPGETWAVVIDGDEVLSNAEYLRDRIEAVAAEDAWKGASVTTPDNVPTSRIPLRLIERDGTISTITARVFRIDLLRSIDVSSSVVTNTAGIQEGWGNYPELTPIWVEAWAAAMERGQLVALPPFPCEPCIVHRSHLRHPLRRGLRMSDQETREFARAQTEQRGQQCSSMTATQARNSTR
jgi:hypothetical protein